MTYKNRFGFRIPRLLGVLLHSVLAHREWAHCPWSTTLCFQFLDLAPKYVHVTSQSTCLHSICSSPVSQQSHQLNIAQVCVHKIETWAIFPESEFQ